MYLREGCGLGNSYPKGRVQEEHTGGSLHRGWGGLFMTQRTVESGASGNWFCSLFQGQKKVKGLQVLDGSRGK